MNFDFGILKIDKVDNVGLKQEHKETAPWINVMKNIIKTKCKNCNNISFYGSATNSFNNFPDGGQICAIYFGAEKGKEVILGYKGMQNDIGSNPLNEDVRLHDNLNYKPDGAEINTFKSFVEDYSTEETQNDFIDLCEKLCIKVKGDINE